MSNNTETRVAMLCPFCNSPEAVIVNSSRGEFVECSDCGARGPLADNRDEAVGQWNAAQRQPVGTCDCIVCGGEDSASPEGIAWVCDRCAAVTVRQPEGSERVCDMDSERLHAAVNAECTCGGRGPDADACPACMVWHRVVDNTTISKQDKS